MRRIKTYLLLFVAVILVACNGFDRPYEGTYEKVLVYVGLGYNNLSGNLLKNLSDMQEGILPGVASNCAIVAFCHNTASNGDYSTVNPPRLVRVLRGSDGKPVLDTLKTYESMSLSPTKESLHEALLDVQKMFPSHSYGMLFSSHGTGWIPAGYQSGNEASSIRQRALSSDDYPYSSFAGVSGESPWPETKAVGNQYILSAKNVRWLELADFVDAIPMRLDYLILDACLMGTVEVAWEFKDICRYFVASPTEILTDGMIYKTLSWDMLSGAQADLQTYCEEYFDYYNGQSGTRRAGTIALVDCSQLDALATAFRAIVDAHRDNMFDCLATVQRYFYSSSTYRFYYDLRDFADQLGATPGELAQLDAALAAAIPYHAETPAFFDLPLERCCGISVYIPDPLRTKLNSFYRTLGWNSATHLVE
ncbi:MAG: hypothetical protein J6W83_05530 [Bacteroidales bacterium]|nr:hypothetical protein [Bacteroidales bacterium]